MRYLIGDFGFMAISALIFNVLATTSGLMLMAASAWLITSAAFHPPLSTLAVGITIVRAAGIFRAVFRYVERLLTHSAIFNVLTELRVKLYKLALTKFPMKSGSTGEGELLHDLIVSADLLKDLFPRVVQPILCSVILTAAVTIFLFRDVGNVAWLLPSSMALTLVFAYATTQIRNDLADSKYREMILDLNIGRDEIFIAGSDSEAVKKLNLEADNICMSNRKILNRNADVDSLCHVINVAAMIFIIYSLTKNVGGIDLAIWLFVLLMMIENFLTLPGMVRNFTDIRHTINATRLSTSNNEDNLNGTAVYNDVLFSVDIRSLTFGYNLETKIFNDFNLRIGRGDKVAIVGESGSGKTTLLYLMLGLWPPDSGQIIINGTIAAATVNNYIFSRSIRENFQILRPCITQEEIRHFLNVCQLEHFNIDENIGENASSLSGGERCRLQTALAMASNPDILVLDEPTAGLDKLTAENLIREILNYADEKNRTLIIITHDSKIAHMLDSVCTINFTSAHHK